MGLYRHSLAYEVISSNLTPDHKNNAEKSRRFSTDSKHNIFISALHFQSQE